MFSTRLPDDLTPNSFATALATLRRRGVPFIDLTESNPTRVGLSYPPSLLDALRHPAGLVYDPQPLGLPEARRAVAIEVGKGGVEIPDSAVVITSSTSEAYSLIFKLLCDPGDEVLVPRPSYPLFEHLTRLDAVVAAPYRIDYEGEWRIDMDTLTAALSPRSRAILVVNPNNPTGSYVHADDAEALGALAARHNVAIISDEVFLDYELATDTRGFSLRQIRDVLVFTLGGLSKLAGLPQMKLAWLIVNGPPALVSDGLRRLEVICDTYLSVATPVQLAAKALLAEGAAIRRQIASRVQSNLRQLRELAAACPACSVLRADGGWYAVVQVPATAAEDALVLALLERDAVIVHPGYFFDFPREAFLVLSLLPETGIFAEGVGRLFRRVVSL